MGHILKPKGFGDNHPFYEEISEVNDGQENVVVDVDCQADVEDNENLVLELVHNWDILETIIDIPHDTGFDIRELKTQINYDENELDMKKNKKEEEMAVPNNRKESPGVSENSLDKRHESIEFKVSEDRFKDVENLTKSLNSRQMVETAPVKKKCFGPISNIVHMMISVDSLYNTQ